MTKRAKKHSKDALFIVSLLLTALGALQATQGVLTEMMRAHPMASGLVIVGISVGTAVLSYLKTRLLLEAEERETSQHSGV